MRRSSLDGVLDPILVLFHRVGEDSLGVQAGSLAYGAFLSIPPTLLIAGSVSGFLLASDPGAQEHVVERIAAAIPGLEAVTREFLRSAVDGRIGVGVVGLIGLVWTASGFAARARHALGAIFRTARTGLVVGRLQAIVLGIPIIAALLGSVLLVAVAGRLESTGSIGVALHLVLEVLVLGASFGVFLVVYRMLTPGQGPTLRGHVPGALVFTLGFAVARVAAEAFVARVVTRATAFYGTIGAVFGLLAFLYLTLWLFLLGAEVSRLVADPSG